MAHSPGVDIAWYSADTIPLPISLAILPSENNFKTFWCKGSGAVMDEDTLKNREQHIMQVNLIYFNLVSDDLKKKRNI